MAVLMGLINTNTLQVIWTMDFRNRSIDARGLQSNLVSSRVRKLFWHMVGANEVDSNRKQPKSGPNLDLCPGQFCSGASHANLVMCAPFPLHSLCLRL